MTNIQRSGSVGWAWDADGVVTVTLDDPGRTANMLNRRHYEGLNACLDDLAGQLDRLRGVVLTSAKRSFIAGPEFEPGEITPEEAATTYDLLVPLRDQARRLETLGRPVAAALNGSALGGGFELALACHYRVGPADPSVIWSLAETGMGIIPGGGGVVRVTRMAGIAATVLDIVGPGTAFHPAEALAAGLVDELAGDVVAAARAWVLAQPEGPFTQRWERPGHEIPGGLSEPPGLSAEVRRRSAGSPVRALEAVREVAVRSAAAPIDEAFEIETAAFRTLIAAPEIPALSHFFFALRTVAGVAAAPVPPGDVVSVREFPSVVANPLAAVFFAPDAPIVEITVASGGESAVASGGEGAGSPTTRGVGATTFGDPAGAVAKGGIPLVIRGGTTSFVQALLDAGPEVEAMAAAARRLLDAGLVVDPAAADVASVLAAGLPPWTGGVLHHLATLPTAQ